MKNYKQVWYIEIFYECSLKYGHLVIGNTVRHHKLQSTKRVGGVLCMGLYITTVQPLQSFRYNLRLICSRSETIYYTARSDIF